MNAVRRKGGRRKKRDSKINSERGKEVCWKVAASERKREKQKEERTKRKKKRGEQRMKKEKSREERGRGVERARKFGKPHRTNLFPLFLSHSLSLAWPFYR